MSRIDELIKQYCPDGVEYVQLAQVATVTIGEFVHKNKQNPNGIYPVYNGGRSETGYYDQYNNDGNKIVISARGAYAGFVNRIFKPYWAGNSSYSVTVKSHSNTDWNYVYYYLKKSENKFTESQQKGGIPAVSKKQVESFKIPIPPLEVQKEIVSILDKFTQLEAELSAELDARRRQYEYYRNQLFVFDESREVKWSKLSDIARVTIGEFVHKNKQNPNGLYPVYNGGRSETGYFDEYNNTGEKIVISARGAYAGFVNRVMKPYWAGNSSYSIDVTDRNKVNWHYVYYYLKSSESKFTEQQQKGGIPAVSKKQVEVFKIPIPPLDEQDRIVSILDKFDNLTNSISEGLPAEINARRRQYEYYRTKLLTFQELSV